MRNLKTLVTDIATKAPLAFPLIGLGHILWLLWIIWTNHSAPFGGLEWLNALWMLCYTVCWLAACDLRTWGALGYLLLTVTNVVLLITLKNPADRDLYTSSIPLIDVLFSFFVLFFYKRFR